VGGLGEAVGINYVSAADLPVLLTRLDQCGDDEYFERGIELAIEHDGTQVGVLDISDHLVVEVDSQEDLEAANAMRGASRQA
jgi:choline kinase